MSDTSRRFGRFQVKLEGSCDFKGQSYAISVLNLSVGGCFFSFINQDQATENSTSGIKLPIEEQVQLTISLTSPVHTLVVESKVAWMDQDEGYGCSFKRLKPLDVWSIIQATRSPDIAFQMTSKESQIDQSID